MKKPNRKTTPMTWMAKKGHGYRLESNSAGYTILDKDGLTVATFDPTEFGPALREWHRLNTVLQA